MKKPTPDLYQLLGSIGLIIACLLAVIKLQQNRIDTTERILTSADYLAQEEAERLRLQILKQLPTFGFDNLMADWLYLQYVQYFGDSNARESIGYVLSPNYMEGVAALDPRFVDALIKLDSGTSIFAGHPERSVAALEKSLEEMPTHLKANFFPPYHLWITKGVNELLFLGDPEAAQKSYETAAELASLYDDPNAQRTANRVSQTAKFLEANPSSKIPQIGAWTMVLSSTSDERTVKRALEEIQALGGEITILPDGGISIRVPEEIE
ncbi:MAG: hypothetical protein AB4041_03160 [Microcystaceae cyanobacterium]